MDNLCHTLMGAAMGEAGLKRRTALGTATLLIGANLPDVDVLSIPFGVSLSFRRGWTHGVLALVVLPLLLTGAMLLWDRRVRRRGGRAPSTPVVPRQLLLLAYLSVLTHPLLDWMNNYGLRWLMPFSGRWFYGDALFIVDPWIWAALALGVVAARRGRGRPRGAAVVALVAVTAYGAAMLATAAAGRGVVERETGREAEVMVGPVPVNPFVRQVVVRDGEAYRFGVLRWTPAPELRLGPPQLEVNAGHPAARLAAATPEGRDFLTWSRFPYFRVEPAGDSVVVRIDDARYGAGGRASFAAVTVRVPVDETGAARAPYGPQVGLRLPRAPDP